jgi:peptidyl-prolyl cis-trans isomerase SurA
MIPRFILTLFFIVLVTSLNAQVESVDVLFTVDDSPVKASEFLRVYNKNLDLVKDESQKDVDEYLRLFINYNLKIKEAKALGYDKKPKYLREFESYKKQLAKNYLTDSNVTEELIREAYDRVSQDVNVDHILIRLPEAETDTAAVYNQMLALRDRFINEDFDALSKEIHNGKTVFAEKLGFFSGFKMVYAFENVAYTTPIGEVSQPFRTQFGYHVLKVNDKRASLGEVTVGHIMITNNSKDTLTDPATRIQEIYSLIQQGENFESVAKQYSEDQSSAKNGGKLSPIKSGQLRSVKFEEKAFSMKTVGEISEPFETDFGWHIAKLYEKKPIEPFEKIKGKLESRVNRDGRSKVITQSVINNLKLKYKVEKEVDLSYFVSIMDDTFFTNSWKVPEGFPENKSIVNIGNTEITYSSFGAYIESQQKSINQKQSFEGVVQKLFNSFLDNEILRYHEENLENVNEEYAHILAEYRDGLLLFDLMESTIWNAGKEDTIGVQNYYNANKSKYMWPDRIDAIIATGSSEMFIEEVKKEFEKNTDLETIKLNVNKTQQNVIFTLGKMTANHRSLPKDFVFEKGVSKVFFYKDVYQVINVLEVIPASQQLLNEAKGKVMNDFQNMVEKEWLQGLRKKYSVKVNENILNKIKSLINN